MFGELVQPVDHLCVAPMLFDQIVQLIVASTSAPLTSHLHGIELADEVAEDDGAVAGHGSSWGLVIDP